MADVLDIGGVVVARNGGSGFVAYDDWHGNTVEFHLNTSQSFRGDKNVQPDDEWKSQIDFYCSIDQ